MEELKDQRVVDGVTVEITYSSAEDMKVTDEEVRAYIDRGNSQHPSSVVEGLKLGVEGEDVNIEYKLSPADFERIRRITGYLVGTMDRWNDGKTAEESDRVKHAV
ncbi:MAG: anaerobic ribonucleoside-triphosphate reductase [Coriobacteriia bacterium]|nr:anaerobic ribonucleoside-triphosphate reductase [Coriobacteriia bacterium]